MRPIPTPWTYDNLSSTSILIGSLLSGACTPPYVLFDKLKFSFFLPRVMAPGF